LGGKLPTGDVPRLSGGLRFCPGNSPCQVFAITFPRGNGSSPQVKTAPSRPPRAANSHSASVGSSLPTQAA